MAFLKAAMKPFLVVTGAFILILGFTLMNTGPTLTEASFYKTEAGIIGNQTTNITNETAATAAYVQLYKNEVNAINEAESVLFLGALLAPVGGAVLALGLVTNRRKEDGAPMQPAVTPAT
jgi:hypothetical protein